GGLRARLVEVQGALGINMPRTRLQGALDYPDPMQFIARQRRIDMTNLQQVAVFHVRAGDLVVVVGDVDFLLAQQLPVITIWCAVEHVGVIRRAQPLGGSNRRVVGQIRSASYTTLAGAVNPGLPLFLDLIESLVDQRSP